MVESSKEYQMNGEVMFVLIAKMASSDVIEGMNSKDVSLAPLARLKLPFFCNDTGISLNLITFAKSRAFRGKLAFAYSWSISI